MLQRTDEQVVAERQDGAERRAQQRLRALVVVHEVREDRVAGRDDREGGGEKTERVERVALAGAPLLGEAGRVQREIEGGAREQAHLVEELAQTFTHPVGATAITHAGSVAHLENGRGGGGA
ncbi:MAG: hypothetical protein ACXVDD_14730, partial [Polyangia bacterium]